MPFAKCVPQKKWHFFFALGRLFFALSNIVQAVQAHVDANLEFTTSELRPVVLALLGDACSAGGVPPFGADSRLSSFPQLAQPIDGTPDAIAHAGHQHQVGCCPNDRYRLLSFLRTFSAFLPVSFFFFCCHSFVSR